ncbi:hypothetical protein NC652_021761 [Populus alba x Populus x berolinensis]|nr:hypothetical protein NC652_021761 [Populus alba x Populus x berolinensis]
MMSLEERMPMRRQRLVCYLWNGELCHPACEFSQDESSRTLCSCTRNLSRFILSSIAEFTLEELDSRKHLLNLQSDLDEAAAILPMVSRRKGDGTSKHSNVSFKGIQKHVLYWISESRKELMLRKQQKLFIHAGLPIGYVTSM